MFSVAGLLGSALFISVARPYYADIVLGVLLGAAMFSETELELALQRCREAVASDSDWTDGLGQLAWVMQADGCSFVNRGGPETRALLPASPRYAEFVKDFVAEGWAKDDLRARRGWPRLDRSGAVLLEHDLTSAEERETMPVYRDLYARHDLYWWASVAFSVRKDIWALSFLRSQAGGPFTTGDAGNLQRLAPLLSGLADLRLASAQARARDAVQLLEKIVGAAAEEGRSLNECADLARKVNAQGRSMGMALTSCTVPHVGKPSFDLPEDEMEIGIGIHGEPGRHRIKLEPADKITEMLLEPVVEDLPYKEGDEVLLFVNSMGGTPLIELYIVYRKAVEMLEAKGIKVVRNLIGPYITSLEMAGMSITLLKLDEDLKKLWDAPVKTAGMRWGM